MDINIPTGKKQLVLNFLGVRNIKRNIEVGFKHHLFHVPPNPSLDPVF